MASGDCWAVRDPYRPAGRSPVGRGSFVKTGQLPGPPVVLNWGEGPFDIPPGPWSQSHFTASSPILLPFTKLFVLFPTR